MQFFKYYFIIASLLVVKISKGQNYQAINGSSFAGNLSVSNNPASIVHVPFAWDVTIFAVQMKQSTNAFKIEKYSLLSSPGNAEISLQNGEKKRFLFNNTDVHLFSTRISLNSTAAIAFGANVKTFSFVTTSKVNGQDSTQMLRDFFAINTNNRPLSGDAVVSSWAELYATYAQTIYDEGGKLLNFGLTLKVNRSLAGGYGRGEGLNYSAVPTNTGVGYELNSGSLQYGYSYNFDKIDNNLSTGANAKKFLKSTNSGISGDVGLEYILQPYDNNEMTGEYAYKTKIGISVMDIGNNKFSYGKYSSLSTAGKLGIADTVLENKFSFVNSLADFNDSLKSIANTFTPLQGNFTIYQPTRLVVNVDQHLVQNIFVNMQLTLPLLSLISKNILYAKDINLFAVTPRWEIKSLGAYLPILYNNRNQLWIGAAFKAGPILLGTHNLANLFSKNKMQVGGFYLALTIRPEKIYDRATHYPTNKSSGREIKGLGCPKL